jgi:hypothetical protein
MLFGSMAFVYDEAGDGDRTCGGSPAQALIGCSGAERSY